ncbi:MAG: tetratricopeptide repeat protein [Steroidobacteraceae bacterium]
MNNRRTINRYTPARIFARGGFLRDLLWVVLLGSLGGVGYSRPFTPSDDSTLLAEVPPGARHAELAAREVAARRLDVALPLAQLYIKRARSTGDLRFLGYAEGVLGPWVGVGARAAGARAPGSVPGPSLATGSADALVLHATVLQSRHEFLRALSVLEEARALRPDDAQAWLTTATVLRVLGRYEQSMSACAQVAVRADSIVAELCKQSIRGLTGDLPSAYAAVAQISSRGMPADERAWHDSELGEMAVRLGREEEAERWFSSGLSASPGDFYIRAAYADLLLRNGRAQEVLTLLRGQETLEPLMLRIAIAQKMLRLPGLEASSARLAAAFAAEAQRGEGIHRREEARFLLDVRGDPRAALAAALENWKIQHECEDVLVLMRAAQAAGVPRAAMAAAAFAREHGVQDVRLAAVMGVRS